MTVHPQVPVAVIFDIDGTLATGSFAQVYALGASGERVFGYTAETVLVEGQPYLNGHHVAGWVDWQCLQLLASLASTPSPSVASGPRTRTRAAARPALYERACNRTVRAMPGAAAWLGTSGRAP